MRNVRLFTYFRVLFNARFYYPVFTVLFLDHGLSLEHFAILNSLWAASIVLLEVPSGALADLIGRRNLIVTATVLMLIEMLLLLLVPPGSAFVLWAFALNRVLSGAAEAAASGADEALAYDSLPEEKREQVWADVLSRTMKWQSLAFVFAMLFGAFVYDFEKLSRLFAMIGVSVPHLELITLKAPIALCLLSSIACLIVALRMVEVSDGDEKVELSKCLSIGAQAFRNTLSAGLWILRSKGAFAVIIVGFCIDSVVRMYMTINSEYYRSLGLSESSFGVIGACLGMIGVFVPALGKKMNQGLSRLAIAALLVSLCGVSLWGMAWRFEPFALVFVLFLYVTMFLMSYFLSLFLNEEAPSKMRATVLSFKGLSFNLAYGLVGLAYSWLVAWIKRGGEMERAFELSMGYFSPFFLGLCCAATIAIFSQRLLLREK